jgi:anthranilate synthase component 1
VGQVTSLLEGFRTGFEIEPIASKYVNCGLFGYMAYDSIRFFEDVKITKSEEKHPDILYKLYRYVIIVDHFSNELNLFEHCYDPNNDAEATRQGLNK